MKISKLLRLRVKIRRFKQAVVEAVVQTAWRQTPPYRPEQHYMRGPGPKWQQKYGSITSLSNL